MDYNFIRSLVEDGKAYWKEIINDKRYVNIKENYEDELYCIDDNNRVFEELMIDFLISLHKPQKEISRTKIGFINEFLGWDCDWIYTLKSRIKDHKLYNKTYENHIPLILKAIVEYTNVMYKNKIYTCKLYPYRILNIYKIIGKEYLNCNEDEVDSKCEERLDKVITLMRSYIEDNLNKVVLKYISELNGDADIAIEKLEDRMKEYTGSELRKTSDDDLVELFELRKTSDDKPAEMCELDKIEKLEDRMKEFTESELKKSSDDNPAELFELGKTSDDKPTELYELKKEWNAIVDLLGHVTVNNGESSAKELIEYRLLFRLLEYLGNAERMTNKQKDIISDLFSFCDINNLFYSDENNVRKALNSVYHKNYEGFEKIDIEILAQVDNQRYETGDNEIFTKKYIDFFINLSKSFIEAGNNKRKKQKLKSAIGEITACAEKYLEPSIYSSFFKPMGRKDNKKSNVKTETEIETVDELIDELNNLIGLEGVKQEVNSLINLIKVRKMREKMGMKQAPMSMHLVFTGNPGSGKTTVARLLSKIYYKLEILSKGHLIEVDRSGLVAGYVGQTALKVMDVIKKAMGGILFIDEAYALTLNREDSDFGYEAVETLLKAMEDNRNDLIIIVAGYTEPMEDFLESNPGLRSRFNKYILFEDYSPEELISIFKLFCRQNDYKAENELIDELNIYFQKLYSSRDDSFSNGRMVRNIFEKVISNQADRLAGENIITKEVLRTLTKEDLDGIISI